MADPVAQDSDTAADAARSARQRLVAALLAAGAAIALLQWWSTTPGPSAPVRRAGSAPVDRDDAAPAALPTGLAPVAGLIRLVSPWESATEGAALVVQIFADGSAVLRRALPLARAPGQPKPSAGDAVVVLPTSSIDRMSPRQRATLLQVIGVLRGERPIPTAAVVAVAVHSEASELVRLLSWEP